MTTPVSLAFGPRNDRLLVAREDSPVIELMDVTAGTVIRTIDHGSDVNKVAFVPDSELFLACSIAGGSAVMRSETGEEVRTFEHTTGAEAVAVSGDGRYVVTTGETTIVVWDAHSGEKLRGIKTTFDDGISNVVISHDGQTILAAGGYGAKQVPVFDGRGNVLLELSHENHDIDVIALAPDGRTQLVGAGEQIVVFDIGGRIVRTLGPHKHGIAGAAFSPDGTLIAVGGHDDHVHLWSAATGELVSKLAGHGCSATNVAFSGDGKLLASAGEDGSVIVWDLGTRKALRRLGATDTASAPALLTLSRKIMALAATPDGSRCAIAAGNISLWSPGEPGAIAIDGHLMIDSIAIDPTGELVAICDDPVRVVSARDGRLLQTIKPQRRPRAVALDRKGTLAIGESDGVVERFDAATGSRDGHHKTYEGRSAFPPDVHAVAFDPSGKLLAVCNTDGPLLIELPGGDCIRLADALKASAIAFTPDGETLATVAGTNVQVWDVATRQCVATLAHEEQVSCIATGPGERIATGAGTTVTIWDRAGAQLATLPRTDPIAALAFASASALIVGSGKLVEVVPIPA